MGCPFRCSFACLGGKRREGRRGVVVVDLYELPHKYSLLHRPSMQLPFVSKGLKSFLVFLSNDDQCKGKDVLWLRRRECSELFWLFRFQHRWCKEHNRFHVNKCLLILRERVCDFCFCVFTHPRWYVDELNMLRIVFGKRIPSGEC